MPYAITFHAPGYMPDAIEPTIVDTLDEARAALSTEIELGWDAEYGYEDTAEWHESVDARYLDAHSSVNTMSLPGYVYVEGPTPTSLGLYYSCDEISDAEAAEWRDDA